MSDMREGRVTYVGWGPAWLSALIWLFFAAFAALSLFASDASGQPGYQTVMGWVAALLFISLPTAVILLMNRDEKRRARYAVVFDKDHVRVEKDGEVEWSLRWSEYAGYRRVPEGGIVNPQFALVDTSGIADYLLPPFSLPPGMVRNNPVDLMRLLEFNAPIGGELPQQYLGKAWKRSTVWIVVACGAVLTPATSVYLAWYLNAAANELDLSSSVNIRVGLSMLGFFAGITALLVGVFELVGRRVRKRRPAAHPVVEPEHHVLTLYEALSFGPWLRKETSDRIYKPRDRDALRAHVRKERNTGIAMLLFFFAVGVAIAIGMASESLIGATILAVFFLGSWTAMILPTLLVISATLKTVDATIKIDSDGTLSLDGQKSEKLTFIRRSFLAQSKVFPAFFAARSRRITVDIKAFELMEPAFQEAPVEQPQS